MALTDAPLALRVTGFDGNVTWLTYVPTTGWKTTDGEDNAPKKVATLPVVTDQPAASASVDQPLTVLIDGPTGYTYVWVADRGWKFLGRVAAQGR